MALLSMLLKENYQLVVCHLNYKKRETSDRDEKIVREFCKQNNLIFECCIADDYVKGNFQNWARERRYQFFEDIYRKYNAKYLFIGHHLDDYLETYFLQEKRKAIVKSYGILENTNYYDMNICRPLLNYTKKDLEDYCSKNNIIYGIDETNLQDKYARNVIRHNVVERMAKEDKLDLKNKIEEKTDLH